MTSRAELWVIAEIRVRRRARGVARRPDARRRRRPPRIQELERQAAAEREELEQRAAAQREELDRLQLLMGRLTRATFPDCLLVAIHHTEHTPGAIDIL